MDRLLEIAESIADTETTAYLLQQDFVIFGLAAIALLGLLSGAIGPFIIMRQMSFSVHGVRPKIRRRPDALGAKYVAIWQLARIAGASLSFDRHSEPVWCMKRFLKNGKGCTNQMSEQAACVRRAWFCSFCSLIACS